MKTPILFLIYNRPKCAKQVLEAIRNARPEKLFVSADGPKKDKENDEQMCEQTRRIVKEVDWPCEIYTNFSDENLGCRLGVTKGINWFFEFVDQGIILEDDCLPSKSFFEYCERLLNMYQDDDKIMMISGSNPATEVEIETDYFFSLFFHVWGWATWKRAWKKMDINLSSWPNYKKINFLDKYYHHNNDNKRFSEKMFDKVYNDKSSSVWAVQWAYSCLINNGLAILPRYNLVSNVGLSGDHIMNPEQLFLKTKNIDFNNFTHPKEIVIHSNIEKLLFEKSGLSKLII